VIHVAHVNDDRQYILRRPAMRYTNGKTVSSISQPWTIWALVAVGLWAAPVARAQSTFDIYGFAMLDMGYQTKQNDAAWFDVLRPTKLPSVANEFGEDGRFFAGVRQTRLGFKSNTPTERGDFRTQFEFEMFGTGVDAGQTTIRLRHAVGQLGQFGAGQTWSPFMDIDVFPNSVEYWGPNGMAFFRNVQVFWQPIQGENRMTIALERPGASADQGDYADRIEQQNVSGRFPVPDLSAEYRVGRGWGYVEASGIVRQVKWDDTDGVAPDLTGDATCWGLHLSSNLKPNDRGTARLSVLYGEGIQNYMNDAPADIGVATDALAPGGIAGVPLPVTGVVAFYDMQWNERWSTSVGYSMVDIDNSDGQSGIAFKRGQYALGNLLYYPVKNVMVGGELQWGDRENKNGFTSDDFRVQFSARYNFAMNFGGQ
jgi:hypothetical protein